MEKKQASIADEQRYKPEADWKEAGEERSDERTGILSDIISGTSNSEELLVYPQNTIIFLSKKFRSFFDYEVELYENAIVAVSVYQASVAEKRTKKT